MIPETAIPPAPGQQEERLPHIEFKLMPVEDRGESMKQGMKIMVDKEFAFIYPRGGKDVVKKEVPQKPKEGEYPSAEYQEFHARFGRQYEAWKQGLEVPVEGTDLRQFRLLTPAQIENCRAIKIFTVEQLAEANEEALKNIGMGSRNLKSSAQRWLEFGNKGGKEVARIEELQEKNQVLTDQIGQLTAKLDEALAALKDAEKPSGRSRKKDK